jgi:hypothetical protein
MVAAGLLLAAWRVVAAGSGGSAAQPALTWEDRLFLPTELAAGGGSAEQAAAPGAHAAQLRRDVQDAVSREDYDGAADLQAQLDASSTVVEPGAAVISELAVLDKLEAQIERQEATLEERAEVAVEDRKKTAVLFVGLSYFPNTHTFDGTPPEELSAWNTTFPDDKVQLDACTECLKFKDPRGHLIDAGFSHPLNCRACTIDYRRTKSNFQK